MKRQWFGTDGIRGIFGKEPMTPEFAWRCGKAAAEFFEGRGKEFILGRDTRESGGILEQALQAGIESSGGKVFRAGVLPTASIAVLTVKRKAVAGIMISASHNPYEDNGIKFFGPDGFKLSDDIEYQIEQKILSIAPAPFSFQKSDLNFHFESSSFQLYKEMILGSLPENFSLQGLTICLDLAHGAAWKTTPEILRSLGAEILCISDQPNGKNINLDCGSLHVEKLQELVRNQKGKAIGLAHDGDADRLVMIDEKGDALDGDELMAIVAVDHLEEKSLSQNTLVATSMSNLGLDECLQKHGGKIIRTDVGDRYVLEAMKAHHCNIGGEQSGHMIFLDHFTTGDGLLSAMQVLKVVVKKKQSLSELRNVIHRYPQMLKSVKVTEKKSLAALPLVAQAVQDSEKQLAGQGRIVLRYSGTENKIRLLIEAKDASLLNPIAEKILDALRREKILSA